MVNQWIQHVKQYANQHGISYSEALKKSKSYINQKVITPDSPFSHLEVFTISKTEIKNPSKWKTELYFPVKPKKTTPIIVPETEKNSDSETETNPTEI